MHGVAVERENDDASKRDKYIVVAVVADTGVVVVARANDAADVSRLPSSRVALNEERLSFPILVISEAANFHRSLGALASSRRSR